MPDYEPSDSFINYLAEVEGSKGYDKASKKYYPYRDAAGHYTIGVGHKVQKQEFDKYRRGLSSDEVMKLLREDLRTTVGDVKRYMSRNGYDWDALDDRRKEMLIDIDFNTGIRKYPKFTESVVLGDEQGMAVHHHRWLTDPATGKKLPLGRNKTFADRYGLEWIDPRTSKILSDMAENAKEASELGVKIGQDF